MNKKKILSSKATVVLLAVLLVLLGNAKYKQWKNQQNIEKEKLNIIAQAEQLEKKNAELKESLSYLDSVNFKERLARQQLNLKREGEVVFNFSEVSGVQDGLDAKKRNNKNNLQKWLEYFTSNK